MRYSDVALVHHDMPWMLKNSTEISESLLNGSGVLLR